MRPRQPCKSARRGGGLGACARGAGGDEDGTRWRVLALPPRRRLERPPPRLPTTRVQVHSAHRCEQDAPGGAASPGSAGKTGRRCGGLGCLLVRWWVDWGAHKCEGWGRTGSTLPSGRRQQGVAARGQVICAKTWSWPSAPPPREDPNDPPGRDAACGGCGGGERRRRGQTDRLVRRASKCVRYAQGAGPRAGPDCSAAPHTGQAATASWVHRGPTNSIGATAATIQV